MYDAKLNKFGRYFWMVMAVVFSGLFFVYFYNENQSIILVSIGPILTIVIWETLGRSVGKMRYYPKNLLEYVVEGVLFFAVYVGVHLLLKDKYLTLQAIYVVAMVAIFAFDTYALISVVKSAKT